MLITITDWLWSYVLIGALLIVGVRFTIGSGANRETDPYYQQRTD